jgi:glycerol-3-phosphate dehydrogenase (NAD(P)+)
MKSSDVNASSDSGFRRIGVAGAGAWGAALALNALKAGREVVVWAREPETARTMSEGLGNPVFLPGVPLPAMPASIDFSILEDCDAILATAPAQHLRSTLAAMSKHVKPGTPVALCSKGIERGTLKLMTEVIAEALPQASAAVLSGPSFAADVARGLPTAVTLACRDRAEGDKWMAAIGRPHFRPYWSDDPIGAEAGGAVKNVLAIACGVSEGMGLGRSAHAALIARGFSEMTRFGVKLGGKPETLAGLCGLGDLVLTCSSPQSRNMSFGMEVGRGAKPADVLRGRTAVTEGAETAPALMQLAAKLGVDMPICEVVAGIVAGELDPKGAMDRLLNRPFREEA